MTVDIASPCRICHTALIATWTIGNAVAPPTDLAASAVSGHPADLAVLFVHRIGDQATARDNAGTARYPAGGAG